MLMKRMYMTTASGYVRDNYIPIYHGVVYIHTLAWVSALLVLTVVGYARASKRGMSNKVPRFFYSLKPTPIDFCSSILSGLTMCLSVNKNRSFILVFIIQKHNQSKQKTINNQCL